MVARSPGRATQGSPEGMAAVPWELHRGGPGRRWRLSLGSSAHAEQRCCAQALGHSPEARDGEGRPGRGHAQPPGAFRWLPFQIAMETFFSLQRSKHLSPTTRFLRSLWILAFQSGFPNPSMFLISILEPSWDTTFTDPTPIDTKCEHSGHHQQVGLCSLESTCNKSYKMRFIHSHWKNTTCLTCVCTGLSMYKKTIFF